MGLRGGPSSRVSSKVSSAPLDFSLRSSQAVGPDYLKGKIKVDEYVTHQRTLATINDGFHDMHVSIDRYRVADCQLTSWLYPGWGLHSLRC